MDGFTPDELRDLGEDIKRMNKDAR